MAPKRGRAEEEEAPSKRLKEEEDRNKEIAKLVAQYLKEQQDAQPRPLENIVSNVASTVKRLFSSADELPYIEKVFIDLFEDVMHVDYEREKVVILPSYPEAVTKYTITVGYVNNVATDKIVQLSDVKGVFAVNTNVDEETGDKVITFCYSENSRAITLYNMTRKITAHDMKTAPKNKVVPLEESDEEPPGNIRETADRVIDYLATHVKIIGECAPADILIRKMVNDINVCVIPVQVEPPVSAEQLKLIRVENIILNSMFSSQENSGKLFLMVDTPLP